MKTTLNFSSPGGLIHLQDHRDCLCVCRQVTTGVLRLPEDFLSFQLTISDAPVRGYRKLDFYVFELYEGVNAVSVVTDARTSRWLECRCNYHHSFAPENGIPLRGAYMLIEDFNDLMRVLRHDGLDVPEHTDAGDKVTLYTRVHKVETN